MTELSELKIKPFQMTDTQALINVIDEVCADTLWMKTIRFEPTPAWQRALENEDCPHHLLAVAYLDCQIIGWCRLFPTNGSQAGPVELGIGVLKPYRQRGVGTSMMGYVIDWAKAKSISEIVLTTHVHNRPALGLFEKFRFYGEAREGQLLRMRLERNAMNVLGRYGYVT